MHPLRVAIVFDQNVGSGGGYHQSVNAALIASQLDPGLAEVMLFTTASENWDQLRRHGLECQLIQIGLFKRAWMYLRRHVRNATILKIIKSVQSYHAFEKKLVDNEIDLVYFVAPSGLARDLEEINFITTVWDLCHRDEPEFPEVRANRESERRDENYRSILPRAIATFVDSEKGKENIINRYGIDENRIHVMPFQGAPAVRRSESLEPLPSKKVLELDHLSAIPYVFYPAQFWAHKNHIYILNGLETLDREFGLRVGAVFCGGDQGNLGYVKSYARKIGIEARVKFVGFVLDDELVQLYRRSLALVMPSYFGPTNLPPLEAFELGVPVLYSDKPEFREQLGDAALFMNLADPSSLAVHLKHLIEDVDLAGSLVRNGSQRLREIETVDRLEVLRGVIKEFAVRRNCWE